MSDAPDKAQGYLGRKVWAVDNKLLKKRSGKSMIKQYAEEL